MSTNLLLRLGAGTAILLFLTTSCGTTGSSGPVAVQFIELGPHTVVTTHNADGTVTANHGGDPELVGPKEVFIQANIFEPVTLQNIVLSYWHAGNKAGSRSVEKTINQTFNPGQGGIGSGHNFEIPGTAQLVECEGLYYMFAASYRRTNGTASLYVGQPHLIMPTKRYSGTGVLQESLCVEPPGPGQ